MSQFDTILEFLDNLSYLYFQTNVVIKWTGRHRTSHTYTHVRCSEIVVVFHVNILILAKYLTKSPVDIVAFSFRGRHFSQMFLARAITLFVLRSLPAPSIQYFPVNTVKFTGILCQYITVVQVFHYFLISSPIAASAVYIIYLFPKKRQQHDTQFFFGLKRHDFTK